jgi:hypothetical protein
MKTALVLWLFFTAAVFAADPQQQPVKEPGAGQKSGDVKRLGSVTWDLDSHKLAWVVQKGSVVNGEFAPYSEQTYEISPKEGMMAADGEMRGLEDQEAAELQRLLDVLSLYCAESVVWWEQAQGTPADHTTKPPKPAEEKPVRVGIIPRRRFPTSTSWPSCCTRGDVRLVPVDRSLTVAAQNATRHRSVA